MIELFIVCLFGLLTCLFEIYCDDDGLIDIDRYRSSEIRHHQSSISGGCISISSGGSRTRTRSISIIIIEEELPWLVEMKKVFYFGRIENYDDFEAVK